MRRVLLGALSAALAGCGGGDSELVRQGESEGSLGPGSPAVVTSGAVRVVFLGTSLTEGLGLDEPATEAWPARIRDLADSVAISVEVRNAGIGGETSAGALARLDWILQQEPDVLVVETGANDGLRGLPLRQLEANLDSIVSRFRLQNPEATLVLAQMEAPPNMGADYTDGFRAVFPRVAERWSVPLIPFLLGGVAGDPSLNQADGRHPTAEGHLLMARNAWPILESFLERQGPP